MWNKLREWHLPQITSCSLLKIVFSVFVNLAGVVAAWHWSNCEIYPKSKGREAQQDGRGWSGSGTALEQL